MVPRWSGGNDALPFGVQHRTDTIRSGARLCRHRRCRYLGATQAASNWLVQVQSPTGTWNRYDFLDRTHVYNTRTAWALARAGKTIGDDSYLESAYRHLDWACDVYADGDIWRLAAFDPAPPRLARQIVRSARSRNLPQFYTSASLHTIAYTLQGLLEASRLVSHPRAERAAVDGASTLADHLATGRLAGFYGADWKAANRSQCVTGVAQMAVVWLTLSRHDCFFRNRGQCGTSKPLRSTNVERSPRRPWGVRGLVTGMGPISTLQVP